MKRIFLICATLLIANCTMAQIITMRSITKLNLQQTFERPKGYDQYVNLAYNTNQVSSTFGVNYIGGYRFNNTFFLGLGTGVDFALLDKRNYSDIGWAKPTTVNIPVYLNFRTNFTKRVWSPYISLSAGARISPATLTDETLGYSYNQSGVLANLSVGVEHKLRNKSSLYFGIGYQLESYLYTQGYETYNNIRLEFSNRLAHGFNIHIGVSF